MNKEEDQMPYLEDGKTKDTQSEQQGIRCQNFKNNLRWIWDTIKGPNIRLISVTDENQDAKQLFEEIMMENFPNLVKEMDIKPQKLRELQKPEIQRGPHQDTA